MVSPKRLAYLDMDTREIIAGGMPVLAQPKRRNGFGGNGWFAMASKGAAALANSGLLGQDYRVLMKLLEKMDYHNRLLICQAELARELNMRPQHFNTSIKRLLEAGILEEGQRVGNTRLFIVSPQFVWKGSAKEHVEVLKQYRQQIAVAH